MAYFELLSQLVCLKHHVISRVLCICRGGQVTSRTRRRRTRKQNKLACSINAKGRCESISKILWAAVSVEDKKKSKSCLGTMIIGACAADGGERRFVKAPLWCLNASQYASGNNKKKRLDERKKAVFAKSNKQSYFKLEFKKQGHQNQHIAGSIYNQFSIKKKQNVTNPVTKDWLLHRSGTGYFKSTEVLLQLHQFSNLYNYNVLLSRPWKGATVKGKRTQAFALCSSLCMEYKLHSLTDLYVF